MRIPVSIAAAEALPPVLREYVAECDRLFGPAGPIDEGGTE